MSTEIDCTKGCSPSPSSTMDTDWDSVLQYVGESLDLEYNEKIELDGQAGDGLAIQIPTPPLSHAGSPIVGDEDKTRTLVSISTTFFPWIPASCNPA